MRNLLLLLIIAGLSFASCKKKDSYDYMCRCKLKSSGLNDTSFIVNAATSGQAIYICHNYADSANAKGKNYTCDID